MTTRTKTRRPAAPVQTSTSKSAWMRDKLAKGMSIADIVRLANTEGRDIGYAFAYGVAKRAGFAETAANRRKSRAVTVDKATGIVTIATTSGPVSVHPDGTITGGHRPVKAPKA